MFQFCLSEVYKSVYRDFYFNLLVMTQTSKCALNVRTTCPVLIHIHSEPCYFTLCLFNYHCAMKVFAEYWNLPGQM